MDIKEINKRLKTLTRRELETLNLMCQGLSYRQMAKEMTITRRGVRSHVSNVGKKLNLRSFDESERARILRDYYCPEAKKGDFDLFDDEAEQETPEPLTPEDDDFLKKLERALVKVDPISIVPEPIIKNGGCLRRFRALIVGIGLGMLATLWLLNALDVIDIGAIISEREPTQIASTPIEEVAQADQVSASEETPLTETLLPSPTETTVSPTNTATSPPTKTPVPLPIIETFDLRIEPEWRQILGTWRVVDEQLTADPGDEWRRIDIGGAAWTNYVIEVDVYSNDWFYPAQVIVRAQDNGYLAFEINIHDSDWILISNGDTTVIAHTGAGTYQVPGGGRYGIQLHFKIEVKGDIFTAYVNGSRILQVQDSTFSNGWTGLAFRTGTSKDEMPRFDNFSITEFE